MSTQPEKLSPVRKMSMVTIGRQKEYKTLIQNMKPCLHYLLTHESFSLKSLQSVSIKAETNGQAKNKDQKKDHTDLRGSVTVCSYVHQKRERPDLLLEVKIQIQKCQREYMVYK